MKAKGVIIWCQHGDCSIGLPAHLYQVLPSICPQCHRETFWRTWRPYYLTLRDWEFLRCQRIDPQEACP